MEAKGAAPVDKTKTTLVNMDGLKYPEYYPYNDPNEFFPDPEPFEFHDRALDADPTMPVFYNDHVKIEEVRGYMFFFPIPFYFYFFFFFFFFFFCDTM